MQYQHLDPVRRKAALEQVNNNRSYQASVFQIDRDPLFNLHVVAEHNLFLESGSSDHIISKRKPQFWQTASPS